METKAEYIEAVTWLTQNAFTSLFELEARLIGSQPHKQDGSPFEVSGVIGIAGPTRGSLVISLPEKLARCLTNRMFGAEDDADVPENDLADCVGEIANILAGNLLPHLEGYDSAEQNISLPNTVIGSHRVVWRSGDAPHDLLLFDTDEGPFTIGIKLEKNA